MQYGVPAFTVPQPEEAMRVLEENASKLDVGCIFFHEWVCFRAQMENAWLKT